MASSPKTSMHQLETTLLKAIHAAGDILAKNINATKRISQKGAIDIVTHVDHASEKAIIKIISKNFPDHSILAEESGAQDGHDYKWVIDPLDGTINFAHSFPMSTVSIAVEHQGKIILGGVLDPFRKELFLGRRGRGATLNGKRIHVSKIAQMEKSLLCTGFPYDQRQHSDFYLKFFKNFLIRSQAVRRCGSAAMDLCNLACGRFDGFWELKLNPWDTAAAFLIVEEAGGTVTDFAGNPYSIYKKEILASNGKLHKEMLGIMKL
ncbi:MAG: inositol monophosphatase [Candidatus Omnitrophica bacterium]|nr:inositol monophosphatase [Candidatus Omnitrophota bacterium]